LAQNGNTNKNDILQNSINGVLGGLLGSFICHPIDVFKNYKQRGANYFEELKIDNLKSGHSGVDIHKNRANAIKILARILYILNKEFNIGIVEIQGGSARNIIPLCAWANLFIQESSIDKMNVLINELSNNIKKEYEVEETEMTIVFNKIPSKEDNKVMEKTFQNNLLKVLNTTFSGVFKLNQYSKRVETSGNLASCICRDNSLEIKTLLRSSSDSSLLDIKNTILSAFEMLKEDIKITQDGYKPWEPNYNSFLTKLASNVYESTFKDKAIVEDVHAGLEPSMIDKANKLDKISIGPNIFDPHSPNESISIRSTQKFYIFLKEILKELAT
jgi:dipeptidase D